MKLFFLTETKSGCYKWRTAIPAKYLARRGHQIQLLTNDPSQYEAPDAMVFFRAHFDHAIAIAVWCKKNKIRVVFDTDDALDLVPQENLHFREIQPRLPVYHRILELADVVTTTTPTLASHLRTRNPNVVVLPNSVDPEEWTPRPKGSGLRIGWTGSPTHFADLNLVLDAVHDLQKQYPFTFVLQGLCKEPNMEELYENLLKQGGKKFFETPLGRSIKRFREKLTGIKYEFHPSVPVVEHAGTVCDLAVDIGIAPLGDDPFNRNKSCIKYYEYAMSGAVTVASHVKPYSEEVSITAKNNRESWKYNLESAINADRDALWREQRDWVLEHRNIQSTVDLWETAYAGAPVAQTAPAFQFA
jgi:glycosyltransferase involved in cell wall biosynthesis